MTVCLQGGGELSPGCRDMDAALLAASDGPVVVTSLASERGWQYAATNAEAVEHFRALGADITAAPDVRDDEAGALAALRGARLIVLPGGSPTRLLEALTHTPVGQLVTDLVADGGSVMGASAGAMVLCSWTVLPEGRPTLAPGLGIVPDTLVVPHWSGSSSWLALVPEGVEVLGLPEESGVLVDGGFMTALGQQPTRLVTQGADLAVGARR